MPKEKTNNRTTRLTARVPAELYQQIKRAAQLRGLSLTAYVIAPAGKDARRTIEETEILRLSREDQIAFARALINPPAPNERLSRAAKSHAALIQQR